MPISKSFWTGLSITALITGLKQPCEILEYDRSRRIHFRRYSARLFSFERNDRKMSRLTEAHHHYYLQRCVALAEQALKEGNDPFGSLLLSANGEVLFEDYNQTGNGNRMLHAELAIAQWAVANLGEEERATAVVYTSGAHCAMCAAAHAW